MGFIFVLKKMILIGGGQEYYGETAQRDAAVVRATARHLFNAVGNSVTIVTGGMPGIPMDFVKEWMAVGGDQVVFIVSAEYNDKLTEHVQDVEYTVMGTTQGERRKALTTLPGLTKAFFVQGGQYSTDEILKCEARGLPTICYVGSGGAAGGVIPYEGNYYHPAEKLPPWVFSVNPADDPEEVGKQFAELLAK